MGLEEFIAGAGIVGLFSASAVVLFRSMRYEDSLTRRLQQEADRLRAENEEQDKRISLLISAMHKGGLEIPKEVWQ